MPAGMSGCIASKPADLISGNSSGSGGSSAGLIQPSGVAIHWIEFSATRQSRVRGSSRPLAGAGRAPPTATPAKDPTVAPTKPRRLKTPATFALLGSGFGSTT
jgi:hypothetical protein